MDRILLLSILIPATFSYIDPGVKLDQNPAVLCENISEPSSQYTP